MHKIIKRGVSLFFISALLFQSILGAYADEQSYDEAKPKIDSVRLTDPSLPATAGDQKGSIGYIISRLFDGDGKISPWFIRGLGGATNNTVLRWSTGNGGEFSAGSILDNGTNVGIGTSPNSYRLNVGGDINFTGVLRQNGAIFNPGGKFQDGATTGEIYYNTGFVGIGNTNPAFTLDVTGDINATNFRGNGSEITNIDGNNISSGIINSARLPSDIVRTTGNQTIAGVKTFSSGLAGEGSQITNINGGNIQNGTISSSQLSTNSVGNAEINNSETFIVGGINAYENSNTPGTDIKIGRDHTQYMTFHGGSQGNFLTSVSTETNPKTFRIVSRGGSTSSTYVFANNGTLSAAGFSGDGSNITNISGDNIQDGTIDSSEIEDNTLTSADILNNTLTNADIADGTVRTNEITNNTITETDISDSFVARNSQLLDGIDSSNFVRDTLGTQNGEINREVKDVGIYSYNVRNTSTNKAPNTNYGSVLTWGAGGGGSAQISAGWTSGDQNSLYFRSIRDTTDNWYNWKQIWHEGNDGFGSGLDSDLLDGIDSTSFIRSDAATNVAADTEWQDNQEVRLGSSADLRLFHNGSNSYMRNFTGNIEFRNFSHGSQVYFQGEDTAGTNRNMIRMDPDNEVNLYYAGSEKLNTRTDGIQVTGTVIASEPTANNHLTTKNYVDTLVSAGVSWKSPTPAGSTPTATHGACGSASEGWATYSIDDDIVYLCNASAWVSIGSTASIPYATTSSAGKVQLSGDIGGTWNNMTINNNAITSSKIAANAVGDDEMINNPTFSTVQVNSGEGFIWEGGVNRITHNDGGGNVQIRFGHKELGGEIFTHGGTAFEIGGDLDSANGSMELKVATNGGAGVGQAVSWGPSLVVGQSNLTWGGNTILTDASSVNADTLDGYDSSQSSIANTVAVRNTSGDINARLFRSEYDSTNSNIGFIMTQVDTASNNYVRPSTPAQFRAAVTDSSYIGIGTSGDQIQDGTIDSSEIQNNTISTLDVASNQFVEYLPGHGLIGPYAGRGSQGNSQGTGGFGYNLAFIRGAGDDLTTGSNNVLIGQNAGNAITEGSNNIMIGVNSGTSVTTGMNNIALNGNLPSATEFNQINIGNQIYARNSNIGLGSGNNNPSAALHVKKSVPSSNPDSGMLFLENTAATWAGANSSIGIRTAGSSAGDPFVSYDILGEYGWSTGVDNSDANKFKISGSWNNLSLNTRLTIDTSGNVGIGIENPERRLHVLGDSRLNGLVIMNSGRGDVLFENNGNDNADGAGITLRTSNNPTNGAIFAVRSSGQAARLWVGQNVTSSATNPFYVGTENDGVSNAAIKLNTNGEVHASAYCDENGGNCKDANVSDGGDLFAIGFYSDETLSYQKNVASVVAVGTAWEVTLSSPPTGNNNYVIIPSVGSNSVPTVTIISPTKFRLQARSSNLNNYLASTFSFIVAK